MRVHFHMFSAPDGRYHAIIGREVHVADDIVATSHTLMTRFGQQGVV